MKVTNLEDKVKSIDNRVTEVENSSSFLAEQSDVCNQTLNSTKTELKKMKKIYDDLENEAKKIEERRTQMEDKLTDLECRSMRDNLIFYGIPETAAEDCENKVKELCKEKLGILNADTFVFDRAHRLGSEQNTRKPRPVVVKFHLYKEREIVRNKSFERETSDRLRRENLGVGVQWPKQVREARRELRPIMIQEKERGKSVRFVKDKLFVNNCQHMESRWRLSKRYTEKFKKRSLGVSREDTCDIMEH